MQWQQVLVYQYLASLTIATYTLLEPELAFVRLEGVQALYGVLVVIERVRAVCSCAHVLIQHHVPPQLPVRVFLLDILPWTTIAQLGVWWSRTRLGAGQGCLGSLLVFLLGGLAMPTTLLRMSGE